MLVETENQISVAPPSQPTMTVKDSSIAPVPKKKSRRNLYIIVGIATVIIIGVIVFLAGRGNKEKPVMVTTEKAFTKTITQIVSATGKIQPEVEVKISPDVSGEIIELPVKEGMAVKKGDLLVKIKPDFYKTQVEQQAAALSGSRSLSLQSKAQVLKAEQEVKRAEELFKQKLLSESDYQTAKTTYESAKATFESSGFDIQRAASSLRQSQTQLSQTTVFAPMSGTISLLNSELGERVVGTSQMAGTEMLRVADLGSMEVRVNVNENDVVNVKVGDTARIGIDAYPNRKFTGVVGQIANTAKTTGLGTQEEVTNFEVKIRVLDKGLALRPGMSATADIETYTVKNAISVPIQSVTVRSTEGMSTEAMSQQREMEAAKNASGTNDADVSNEKKQRDAEKAERAKLVRVVFIKNGDAVKMQKVETGIADNTHIEIKSGLKAGDEVVSGSYRAISRDLKDGAKVMPEPQAKDAPKK